MPYFVFGFFTPFLVFGLLGLIVSTGFGRDISEGSNVLFLFGGMFFGFAVVLLVLAKILPLRSW